MKIGLIGTGMMGSAIARRLLANGYELILYNRTREKAERLTIFNAKVADNPREVAQEADIIFTILRDINAIRSICFDPNGIVYTNREVILADVSTISPIHSINLAKDLEKYNIVMLDTPVMGGPSLAESGELIVLTAGKKSVIDVYNELFHTIGKKVFYLGSNGSAHAMKLSLNLQIAMIALALSEGIILTKRYGLDPAIFLEVLNSTYFKTGMSERKGPKMIKNNFEKSFALEMMLKDLSEINFTAKELDLVLPMSNIAEEIYRIATHLGYNDIDYTGILAFLEKINKVEI